MNSRSLVLLYVENAATYGSEVNRDRWAEHGREIIASGWHGPLGLCPSPRTLPEIDQGPPTPRKSVGLRTLSHMGCKQAKLVPELGIKPHEPLDGLLQRAVAEAREQYGEPTLAHFKETLKRLGSLGVLQARLNTLKARLSKECARIDLNDTLFVVGEFRWLLLALAAEVVEPSYHGQMLNRSLRDFPEMVFLRPDGAWAGFINL